MSAWQEYKKKRAQELSNGSVVRPTDLLDKQNYTTEEMSKMRMEICEACPKLIKLTKQCKECGCFMNLKTKLTAATCPLSKW